MKTNLFRDLPVDVPTEVIQTLIEQPGVRIERIVSTGQASPPGFWYDQSEGMGHTARRRSPIAIRIAR
jgi:cupin 2 domain-containing protein